MSFVNSEKKELFEKQENFEKMLIDCLGCKWTMRLLDNLSQEINRPGQLVKEIDGLTTKVLNQNLNRMLSYGLIEKHVYAEIPQKVEYALTPFGLELYKVLLRLGDLQRQYLQ